MQKIFLYFSKMRELKNLKESIELWHVYSQFFTITNPIVKVLQLMTMRRSSSMSNHKSLLKTWIFFYWLWRIFLKFIIWLISLIILNIFFYSLFSVMYAACIAIKSRRALSCCVSSINYRKHWTSSLLIEGFHKWYRSIKN